MAENPRAFTFERVKCKEHRAGEPVATLGVKVFRFCKACNKLLNGKASGAKR